MHFRSCKQTYCFDKIYQCVTSPLCLSTAITELNAYANSKDSDQTAHLCNLFRAFLFQHTVYGAYGLYMHYTQTLPTLQGFTLVYGFAVCRDAEPQFCVFRLNSCVKTSSGPNWPCFMYTKTCYDIVHVLKGICDTNYNMLLHCSSLPVSCLCCFSHQQEFVAMSAI